MRRFPLISLLGWGLLWGSLCGLSPSGFQALEAGNQLLKKGDAPAAVERYQSALEAAPKVPLLHYNLGTAQLASGDLDGAEIALQDALTLAAQAKTVPAALPSYAAYNLGNALLARAEAQPEQAKNDLGKALDAFRQAVAADPEDMDARRNLQLAASRLQELAQQDGKDEQSSESDESSEDGEQKPGEKGESSEQDQSSSDESDAQEQSAQSEPSDTGDASDAGEKSDTGDASEGESNTDDAPQDGQEQMASSDGTPQNGLTRQQVERVLESLARNEAATLREAMRRSMGPRVAVERDW